MQARPLRRSRLDRHLPFKGGAMVDSIGLLHPDVLAQKCWDVEILALHNGRFAFLESTTTDRFELQNFLFGLDLFRSRLFRSYRFLLWNNQAGLRLRFF